uniref:Uncharacterized protein n=1 Tax=Anguilla anguilla TaxID=7936 RepID=A0A0E9Q099_ANGAN
MRKLNGIEQGSTDSECLFSLFFEDQSAKLLNFRSSTYCISLYINTEH